MSRSGIQCCPKYVQLWVSWNLGELVRFCLATFCSCGKILTKWKQASPRNDTSRHRERQPPICSARVNITYWVTACNLCLLSMSYHITVTSTLLTFVFSHSRYVKLYWATVFKWGYSDIVSIHNGAVSSGSGIDCPNPVWYLSIFPSNDYWTNWSNINKDQHMLADWQHQE